METTLDGNGYAGGAELILLYSLVATGSSFLYNSVFFCLIEAYNSVTALFSHPTSSVERIAKAEAEIREKVTRSSKVRYWTATVKAGYVDIGRPLTFRQAVHEVRAGRSVFAVTWFEAKAVAVEAGGRSGYNNRQLSPEIDSGKENVPGFYFHYHTYNRSGGHVYYLFGEV